MEDMGWGTVSPPNRGSIQSMEGGLTMTQKEPPFGPLLPLQPSFRAPPSLPPGYALFIPTLELGPLLIVPVE